MLSRQRMTVCHGVACELRQSDEGEILVSSQDWRDRSSSSLGPERFGACSKNGAGIMGEPVHIENPLMSSWSEVSAVGFGLLAHDEPVSSRLQISPIGMRKQWRSNDEELASISNSG